MNRLEQLFDKLGYNRENGLFYLEESDRWLDKFPFRISKVLSDIIKPYAFYSIHHNGLENDGHPEPINNPLILFFDQPNEETKKNIPRWCFCFGQAPIIIINNGDFGPLDIRHGYSFETKNLEWLQKIDVDENMFSLTNLSLGHTWKNLYASHFRKTPKVDKYLLKNIIDARRILVAKDGLGLLPKAANRLIGRVLFIRYLIDRRVVFREQTLITGEDKVSRQESLNNILLNKDSTYKLFDYFTEKYKGDLFPLVEFGKGEDGHEVKIYDERDIVQGEHLEVLHQLFSCSSFFKAGGTHNGYIIQASLFKIYDFEVIPVELISNIYENFIGKKEENDISKLSKLTSKQFDIKAFYTPPFLVDYVLSQTVSPFLSKSNVASCRILDPACGSGIFLVESLRKIVERHIQIERQVNQAKEYTIKNETLWQLLRDNIFGIDIDNDAIEVTIFSLYITLLDYKTPIEIEGFKFERLKGTNLFGGDEADFFNEDAAYVELFKNKVALDFIIGNPPWGKVKKSKYVEYIIKRSSNEIQTTVRDTRTPLEIGNKEIAQAFLVRVSDIIQEDKQTECAFIVTGKCLYNSDMTAKNWRQYFLSNYLIRQVVELSSVNNKNAGGAQIFEAARQPAAIIFYSPESNTELIAENHIRHITVRTNRFFYYFRTIVIEKHDVKTVSQRFFNVQDGGHDWLWKVLVHGNTLDLYFIRRIKDQYPTVAKLLEQHQLVYNGGLKLVDGSRKNRTDHVLDYLYLEIETRKEFQPFSVSPLRTWREELKYLSDPQNGDEPKIGKDGTIGYLPEERFFRGPKLLIKKGLQDDLKAVSAYTDKNILFTDSIFTVIQDKDESDDKAITLLKALPAFFNSVLFSYYTLCTASSAGVERTRTYFDEFLNFPVAASEEVLANLAAEVINVQALNQQHIDLTRRAEFFIDDFAVSNNRTAYKAAVNQINELVNAAYRIDGIESCLIDYMINIALPVFKRSEHSGFKNASIFSPLSVAIQQDREFLSQYADVFVQHFQHQFNPEKQYFNVEIHVTKDYIGFNFVVDDLSVEKQRVSFFNSSEKQLLSLVGYLSIFQVSRDLYIQQDVRGFNDTSFYLIKPNEKKVWHAAVGHHDLLEFIEALTSATN